MEFETPEAAQAAYDSMQGQSVDGREIYVDFAYERRDGAFSSIFFVNCKSENSMGRHFPVGEF